ncbi:TPA: hypothetical protein ACGO1T_001866 [Streptococcus suis]
MSLYYNGQYVDTIREYMYGNKLMAEISVQGATYFVERKDLTDTPEVSSAKEPVSKEKPEATNNENINKAETVEEKSDPVIEDETVYIATNGNQTIRFKSVKDKNVLRYKFSQEAINNVIEGKQKQHKGFTFEVESK